MSSRRYFSYHGLAFSVANETNLYKSALYIEKSGAIKSTAIKEINKNTTKMLGSDAIMHSSPTSSPAFNVEDDSFFFKRTCVF